MATEVTHLSAAQSQAGAPRHRWLDEWGALVAVCTATVMLLVDFMAVSVSLPSVQEGIGASFSQLQWVIEAFVVTTAAFTLTAGYISDLIGRRRIFITGLYVFAVGSLGASLSNLPGLLIGWRVVQGIGGAMLFATGSVILSETFRRVDGRRALAVWGTVTGVSVAVSPVIGGALTHAFGWRALFALEAAVTVAALVIATVAVKEPPMSLRGLIPKEALSTVAPGTPVTHDSGTHDSGTHDSGTHDSGTHDSGTHDSGTHDPGTHDPGTNEPGAVHAKGAAAAPGSTGPGAEANGSRPGSAQGREAVLPNPPDWRGLGFFTAAIAIMVIGLVRTTTTLGSFSSSGVVALMTCTALLLIAFVAIELVTPAPMLDVSLFGNRTFAGASIAAFGLAMAVYGPVLCLVIYLSTDLGYSTLTIGTVVLALTGVTLLFLPWSGWLERHIPVKALICGGLALVAAGFYVMSHVSRAHVWIYLVPGLVVAGIGLELVNPRLAAAAAATVKPHLAAVASRTISTCRQLGIAVGVAVSCSVLATRLTDDIGVNISMTPSQAELQGLIAGDVLDNHMARAAGQVQGGSANLRPLVHSGFADAMHEVFIVAALAALVSAVLALIVKARDVAVRTAPAGARQSRADAAAPTWAPRPEPAPAVQTTPEPVSDVGPAPSGSGEEVSFGRKLAELMAQEGQAAPTPAEPTLPGPVAPSPTSVPQLPPTGPTSAPPSGPWPPRPTASGGTPTEHGAKREEPTLHTIDLTTAQRWVRGRVTATTGTPLPGAVITLVGPDGDEAGHAIAAADGTFSVPSDKEGTFTLVAAAPHHRATASVVTVRTGVASADVELLGVGSLAGRVTRQSDHAPLRAEIELVGAGGTTAMVANSDDDGAFILPDVLEGDYEVVARRAGYEPEKATVSVGAGASRQIALRLTGIGHVYGSVSSAAGAWLPDIPVVLSDRGGRQVASTTTDGAGSFHLPPVHEGYYHVTVRGAPRTAVPIELRPGAALCVDLTVNS